MKKILITGGSGLLGGNMTMMASEIDRFEVHTNYKSHPIQIKNCKTFFLDITDRERVLQKITKIKPDLIIHTAALTDVDYCEHHQEETWKLNVIATKNMAIAAKKVEAKLVYISTDSIFDGKRGMYVEGDKPNPLNYYAKTKLEGERVIERQGINYAMIRTNIYGWNMQNKFSLAEWIINSLKNKNVLTAFKDVFFTPILVNNLSEAIFEISEKDLQGIFNVAGSERCSKLAFARKIGEIFNFDKVYIKPISIDDLDLKATRPKDTSLNINKAKKKLDTKLLNVEEGLIWMEKLLKNNFVKNLKHSIKD